MPIMIKDKTIKRINVIKDGVTKPLASVKMITGEIVFDTNTTIFYALSDRMYMFSTANNSIYASGAAFRVIKSDAWVSDKINISILTRPGQMWTAGPSFPARRHNLVISKTNLTPTVVWQQNGFGQMDGGLSIDTITFSSGDVSKTIKIGRDWGDAPLIYDTPVTLIEYKRDTISLANV